MDLAPRILEGDHVRLEPLAPEHLDALCAVGLDPELWRLSVSRIATRDDMRAYLQTALDEAGQGSALPFATVERSSGKVVGSTRFANADRANRRVEIGWTWIGRPWQRTPLNTEAKYLMLRHAFETLGLIRVEFKTDVLNERSRRALLRIGAKEEGILRAHMITAGGRLRDSIYFSIVAPEWPGVRAWLEERLARGPAAVPGAQLAGGGLAGSPKKPIGSPGEPPPAGGPPLRRGARALPGGFELDDDPARLDVAEIHRYLSQESYWAAGRPRVTVERLIREASRVVGLYLAGRQVGFARAVSDDQSFAYLADVYVLPQFRGRGLGVELVREAVENSPFADRRWLLHTADAHGLYRKVGFGPPGERLMERAPTNVASGASVARESEPPVSGSAR
jgi:RimJ/RimL family protein N-acetyltransferase/ribosomal protein S18 acetylase RimI-like enzyme